MKFVVKKYYICSIVLLLVTLCLFHHSLQVKEVLLKKKRKMKVKWCLPHDINNNNPTFGEYRIGTKKTKVVLYVLRALAYGIFKIFYFIILKVTLSIIPHHFTTFPTSQTLFLFSLYLNIFFNYFLLFLSLFIFHSFSLFL